MLSSDDLTKLRKAGSVSAAARDLGMDMVAEGVKLLDVAEEVESYIRSKGCGLAFPCNISLNEIAAHYTPSSNDKTVFEIGDVVKIDCGAHVDGFVGDTAGTVEVGTNRYRDLIESSRRARDMVMEFIGEGTTMSDIGSAVNSSIVSDGFVPVRNLTGHEITRYNLHSGLAVPNYDDGNKTPLAAGMIIACEPFATNGEGMIKAGRPGNICRIARERPILDQDARDFFEYVKEEFSTFPFCARSCDYPKAELLTKKLLRHGIITSYAVLKEVRGGCVTQSEHTVYIGGPRGEVMTLP
ncbi:MAG: type II methionyl aminopeptidase [Thermoplasmatales archaeon]|jgi:methionyl aminopeptidase|nr:type II methionyl aminopeptidase [Thermoplasmatales archaeon]